MKTRLIQSLYPRVMDGLPVLGTPEAVVERHTRAGRVRLGTMTTHYTVLAGATGFVTGLPGFLMMPITLPADVVGNLSIQLHMAAAYAVVGGYDPRHPAVQAECMQCVQTQIADDGVNDETEEVVKRAGSKLGERLVRFAFQRAGRSAAKLAGKRLGFGRLPVLGGLIGGGSDIVMTRHIAECARLTFLDGKPALPLEAEALADVEAQTEEARA